MATNNRGWILIDGRIPDFVLRRAWSAKDADALSALYRAARGLSTLEEYDDLEAAFVEACEAGDLSKVEAEVGLRALERALTRLEGGASTQAPEGKAGGAGGAIEYGSPIKGVVLR